MFAWSRQAACTQDVIDAIGERPTPNFTDPDTTS